MKRSRSVFPSSAFVVAALQVLVAAGCIHRGAAPARPAPVPPLLASEGLAAVTADLQKSIPSLMAKARIPGLQIALVRDGRVAWHRSFGVRDARSGEAVTDETIFEAASLTKPFFAYYAMKLVDQGVLSLDRPLTQYLPVEKIVEILGHPLDEKGFHREWLEKVTARHVLSHSSGFPHGEGGKPYPLFFEPGTKWKYSADGYFFLQRVIEHLRGDTLDRLMQREVLDPLGMTRSAMIWKTDYEAAMASGHGLLGSPEAFRKRTKAHAGASLYTTAEDYAKFLCAVLNGQGLGSDLMKEMITSQIDMDKPKGLGWSLGFGTQTDVNGLSLWQWGDYGIFRNYVIGYPEGKTGLVYLTNSFYGLGVCPDLVRRGLGGQALGSIALNYRPYDSPLYRFVWDLQKKGPKAVKELARLTRKYPGLFERNWLQYFADTFREAGLTPQAVALLEYDLEQHPRSGKAAFAAAEAILSKGERERARRYFEMALRAAEEPAEKTVVEWRLAYLSALDKPAAADLSGEWSGMLWTPDGQVDPATMVLRIGGGTYSGTLVDGLGLVPAGTELRDAVRAGDAFTFRFNIPLEGGMVVQVTLTLQGETMKGRWSDTQSGNGGPVEFLRRSASTGTN